MTIALFDLDNTLLEGDCERLWCQFLAEKRLVNTLYMNQIDKFFEDYAQGNLDFFTYESFILRPLAQYNPDQLTTLRKEFLKRIRSLLRPFMLKRIIDHQCQGHILILCTASNSFLAQPIADILDIQNLICTEIETLNHVPTGNLLGIPAFKDGKVKKMDIWLAEHKQSMVNSWAYSDSYNDLPILRKVTYPVAVTPEPNLFNHAIDHGWEILA